MTLVTLIRVPTGIVWPEEQVQLFMGRKGRAVQFLVADCVREASLSRKAMLEPGTDQPSKARSIDWLLPVSPLTHAIRRATGEEQDSVAKYKPMQESLDSVCNNCTFYSLCRLSLNFHINIPFGEGRQVGPLFVALVFLEFALWPGCP